MGSLLTFPAPALPSVCEVNELAVLVLLPVSAWRVVLADGIGPPAAGVCEPQAARNATRQSAEAAIKERGRVLRFTGTTSSRLKPQPGLALCYLSAPCYLSMEHV